MASWGNWGWGMTVGGNYEFCVGESHSKNVKKAYGLSFGLLHQN